MLFNISDALELTWKKYYLFVDKLSGDRIKQVMEHIWKLQEFCNSMAKIDIDGYEYAYLKAIVLFSPGKEYSNSIYLNNKHSYVNVVAMFYEAHVLRWECSVKLWIKWVIHNDLSQTIYIF